MINSHVFPIGFEQFGILLICLIVAAAATSSLLAETLRESGLGLSPAELRCEYRADPLGIDVSRPRLSWIVTSAERGQRQTGYQVLVAGSEAILKLDKGDLWDSGQVKSDDTTAIVYGGKPLLSNQPCYWKVKVWDKDGKPSTWSSLAVWSMGLLEPSDWKGEWIGYDKPRATTASGPASGAAKPESAKLVLPPPSYLRVTFPVRKPVSRATVYSTALGIHDLHLNGQRVSDDYFNPGWTDYTRRVYYRAYDVTNRIHPGDNALGAILADGWYSGYVGFGKQRDHYGKHTRLKSSTAPRVCRRQHRNRGDRDKLEGGDRPDPRGRFPHGRNLRRASGRSWLGRTWVRRRRLGRRSSPAPRSNP